MSFGSGWSSEDELAEELAGGDVDDLDVEYATADWVDWYNHRRLHSSLGMLTPREFEQAHYAARQAVGSTT